GGWGGIWEGGGLRGGWVVGWGGTMGRQRMGGRGACRVPSSPSPAGTNTELNHGTTIFAQCFEGRRARNAQAQTGHAQEGKKRKKGEKPQAGHCHRPLGSSQKREKGPAQGQIARTPTGLAASYPHRVAPEILAERFECRGTDPLATQTGWGVTGGGGTRTDEPAGQPHAAHLGAAADHPMDGERLKHRSGKPADGAFLDGDEHLMLAREAKEQVRIE